MLDENVPRLNPECAGPAHLRRVADKTLQVHVEALFSELRRALDEYIELLSSGNVKEFLAKGGGANLDLSRYEILKFCENKIDTTNDAEWQTFCDAFRSNSEKIMEHAIGQVDITSALQELKRLRSETPRVSPILFSPDFDVLYTLPPNEAGQPQTVLRIEGHGSTWTFHRD